MRQNYVKSFLRYNKMKKKNYPLVWLFYTKNTMPLAKPTSIWKSILKIFQKCTKIITKRRKNWKKCDKKNIQKKYQKTLPQKNYLKKYKNHKKKSQNNSKNTAKKLQNQTTKKSQKKYIPPRMKKNVTRNHNIKKVVKQKFHSM